MQGLVNGVKFLEVLDEEWVEDSGRFIASVNIAGCLMHLEAFPVVQDSSLNVQSFEDMWDETLGSIHYAIRADGPWETTEIHGRECVLIATPFC